MTAGRFYYPWHHTVIRVKEYLSMQLFTFNPALQRIFHEFNTRYIDFRMIDLESIIKQMPFTISDFRQIAYEQIEVNKQYLIRVWLKECADIINDNKDSIESLTTEIEPVCLFIFLNKISNYISIIIDVNL